ncbi:MAG: phosphoribosyltransferase family protein [Patescibacteria group bacterium]
MRIINNIKKILIDFLFPQVKPTELSVDKIIEELKKPTDLDDPDIIVLSDYKQTLAKKLIWELKYKNNEHSAKILAEIMYTEIIGYLNDWIMFEDFKDPVLIPVPLSKEKLEKRGYNQTETLVEQIILLDQGKNLGFEFDAIHKVKDTPEQSSLKTKVQRLKNLKNCFKVVNPEKIKNKNIIIVDDVITTGATIKEVKKILKKAGARKIKAICVAH